MAWEDRNGRQYYYRKKRGGKRVKSEYIGAGELGEASAKLVELNKRRRERLRKDHALVKGEFKAIESAVDEFSDLVQHLLRANLLIADHHTHHGQWRRVRK